jgi:hypothetical protein
VASISIRRRICIQGLTAGLKEAVRVGGNTGLLFIAIPEVFLERFQSQDTSDDASVVGEDEGTYAADSYKEEGFDFASCGRHSVGPAFDLNVSLRCF